MIKSILGRLEMSLVRLRSTSKFLEGLDLIPTRLKTLPKSLQVLRAMIEAHRFALAAFLIPLGVRSIPEILVGPYPIGWDTITYYVPYTLDWSRGRFDHLGIVGVAPLLYLISVPLYDLVRADPIYIFKVAGPILYGTMIFALYRFLRLSAGLVVRDASFVAILTSVYFVTLRIGWDMYREVMGIAFILFSLPLLSRSLNLRDTCLASILVLLAVASDHRSCDLILNHDQGNLELVGR